VVSPLKITLFKQLTLSLPVHYGFTQASSFRYLYSNRTDEGGTRT